MTQARDQMAAAIAAITAATDLDHLDDLADVASRRIAEAAGFDLDQIDAMPDVDEDDPVIAEAAALIVALAMVGGQLARGVPLRDLAVHVALTGDGE